MDLSEIRARATQLTQGLPSSLLKDEAEIEAFRVQYVSKSGALSGLFSELRALSVEEKREVAPPT